MPALRHLSVFAVSVQKARNEITSVLIQLSLAVSLQIHPVAKPDFVVGIPWLPN